MKLIASLAPARAEIEAGAVAKADQKSIETWNFFYSRNETYTE